MRKHISTLLFIAGGMIAANNAYSQTPVNPSKFPGHYFTETKMQITKSGGKKKSDELDLSFDEKTGALTGISPDVPDNRNKVMFSADMYKRKWASETGIWLFANSNSNGIDFGKEMFDYLKMTMAIFIEDGVLVLFEANSNSKDKSKAFFAKMEPERIRIIAKDKSKLNMDKMVAAQKAEDMVNAAAGKQLTKIRNDQEKAMLNVPTETLTKTDKALKEEVMDLLKSYIDNNQPLDFLCAYSTSADWKINTNNLTGAILSRELQVEMILQNRDSKNCWRNPYTVTAPYNGSGYGKLTFKSKWDVQKCDCAQVDKNK